MDFLKSLWVMKKQAVIHIKLKPQSLITDQNLQSQLQSLTSDFNNKVQLHPTSNTNPNH